MMAFKNTVQLLLNSEMTDLSGWTYPATDTSNGTHAMSGGRIYVEQTTWGVPAIAVSQSVVLEAGQSYRVEYDIEHGGSGFNGALVISHGGTELINISLPNNARTISTYTFTATTTTSHTLQAGRGGGGASLGEFMYYEYIRLFEV